jgi:hypothetical protein
MAQLKDFQSGAAGDNITVVGTLAAKGTSASGADLKLYEDTDNGTNYVGFMAPASIASNVQWTLPSADGSSGQALQTNGSGTLSFATLGISAGGTGQTTANAAFNALAPSQTSNAGRYLKTDGTNTSWDLLDISTADITGTLPVANGGTGITSFGTGVATALGINVGSSGAFVTNGGALGTPSSGTVTNLTGTASININGTVGATTPNTGSFTTLTTSSTVTINGGTANGVAYLDGSKVLTTGSALTFDGTTLGVSSGGSTPALRVFGAGTGQGQLQFGSVNGYLIQGGADYLGINFNTNNATRYSISDTGVSTWYVGGTRSMDLTSTGLGIGTSSPVAKLHVSGANTVTNSRGTVFVGSDSSWAINQGGQIALGGTFQGDATQIAFGNIAGRKENSTVGSGNGYLAFATSANNGVLSECARIDSSGNLGLGVTPSAWGQGRAFEISAVGEGLWGNGLGDIWMINGAYFNSGWKYSGTTRATAYRQGAGTTDGSHAWYTAASGTAGNAISFTQAMTLDASSRLGIKQTSPTVDLDVGANDSTVAALSVRYSTVPAYLSNSFDGTVGLTTLSVNSYNTSSGSASWSAFQNTAYGNAAVQIASGTGGADIRFLTAAAANTNPTERARITSGGDLLVGTTTATSSGVKPLKINNATNPGIVTAYADTEKAYHYMPSATIWRGETVTGVAIEFSAGNSNGVSLASGGTSWTSLSDERKKDIIEPITDAANKISTLRAVIGKYKTDEEGIRRAFLIAQDVQKVLPEAVNATDPNSLGIQYTETIPLLVSAIQELKSELDSVKAELATLKGA